MGLTAALPSANISGMSPSRLPVILLLLALLLPGFGPLAAAQRTCAIHGKKCAVTCRQKKTCRLHKGTGKMARPMSGTDKRCAAINGCRHEGRPFATLSIKELPGQIFFPVLHPPIPENYLTEQSCFYNAPRPLIPHRPPQSLFS